MKTHEKYIEELSQINPQIFVRGIYKGKEKSITVECTVCKYVWNPKAGSLLRGCGCPNCAGNAPKTTESFIQEITNLRSDIIILGEYCGANKKILTRCKKCNTEWFPTPSKLLAGRGCPECAKGRTTQKRINTFIEKRGSLAELYPDLLKDWDYHKNDMLRLTPKELTPKSNIRAWWICSVCGYEYESSISNRTNCGSGCPCCAGRVVISGVNDIFTIDPNLKNEWDFQANAEEAIFPEHLSKGSEVNAHWICRRCGDRWTAKVYSRIAGSGCPACAKEVRTSLPEQTIFFYMKKIDKDAINTYQPEWLVPSEIDIYLPSLNFGIEYDGEGFHKDVEKDEFKSKLCLDNGITLLHVREPKCPAMSSEVLCYTRPNKKQNQLDEMIRSIVNIINETCKTSYHLDISFVRDQNDIYQLYLTKRKNRSIASNVEAMLDWNWSKNAGINPELVSAGSNMRVWWKCHLCGNESYGMISDHQTHQCSVCGRVSNDSRKRMIIEAGTNSFHVLYPEIFKEWNYELNSSLNPLKLTYQSRVKAFWKCSKCSYVWESTVANRVNGQGCPFCAGKTVIAGINDLATVFPELALQWVECIDDSSLSPSSISPGSNKKIRWRCNTCCGEWIVSVNSRTKNNRIHGCPFCLNERVLTGFNDLKTINPKIAKEWDNEKNGDKSPKTTLNKSSQKVWWRCSICGFSWKTTVSSRTSSNKSNCPNCAKTMAGQHFKKKVLQYSLNGDYIKSFDSLTEAAKSVGVSNSSICNAIKRNGSSSGYRWKFSER